MPLLSLKSHSRFREADARRYIESVMRDQGRIFHTAYDLKRLPNGTHPNVYRIQWDDAPPMVIRFHRLSREGEGEGYFRYQHFLTRYGFPIPAPIAEDRTPATRRQFGMEVSVELFLEGEHFQGNHRENPGVARELARLMHRFHAVTSFLPGLPWFADPPPYFDRLMARVAHFHHKALKARLLSRSEIQAQTEWFERWRERLAPIDRFNLVHGDLNWKNVILQPTGEIAVIDFAATHFGLFELDLAESARSLFCDAAAAHETFLHEYFALAGAAAHDRYQRHDPFFRAFVNLEKAASNAVKSSKVLRGAKNKKLPYAEKSERFLNALREIMTRE